VPGVAAASAGGVGGSWRGVNTAAGPGVRTGDIVGVRGMPAV